ncbi:IbrB-like domain-containing protein [Serratia plymuthica]|uniref:IbrB-like domain-containing protein n=1 Tax=Serratia plymuthica TaxID=82996 RepID=UPI0018D9496F|nr:ParB/RepB/Spo0J family partition protein [Serratia plymuthica]QPS54950.1 ParB-like nuclease domain-containing protein [Serratia plymuthica]
MGNYMTLSEIKSVIIKYLNEITSDDEKINSINQLKSTLHEFSPFSKEPVDCVLWVKTNQIVANDYNPNRMAPSEKKLLKHSLNTNGFTQPIVVHEENGRYTVVDGFHRYVTGNKITRLKKYLPITCVTPEQGVKSCRVAATIRHNRARGKHYVEPMCDIVRELSRLGWSDERISNELGMDADEVLRLKQISGLAELFRQDNFSEAWTVK